MLENIKIDSSTLPVDFVERLAECNMRMFSKLNANDVYKAILETSFSLVKKTKVALLFIINQENEKLEIAGKKGIEDKNIKNKVIKIDKGNSGKAVQNGLKQIRYDLSNCSEHIPEEILLRKKVQTSVYLPLKIVGKVIGVLNLYLRRAKQFTPVEEVMLDILAGHAVIAIQNANLCKSIQHSYDDMDFVIKIIKDITSTLELNRVLKNILRASQQIADTNITFLWYKDLTTKKWNRTFPENLKSKGLKLPNIEDGEGIIGQVLKSGKPYSCNNVTTDPYYFNTWKKTKSELAIPLIIHDDVKGILDVESPKFNAFTERHLRLLTMLAGQAAIALRNAQLFEIAERKTRQFITLKEIGEALSQQKRLKEILGIIARESLSLVGSGKKVCFVMLIDKEKKMLETKAAYGELFGEEHFDFHIPLSQKSIVAWVVKNGKPRIAPDVTKDSEYLEITPESQSEICIPLFFRNDVIGVIDIESSELNAFNDQDVELLQTLADNTAIGTKIGELCDIRLKQLEALYNTGTKISSSLNLNEVLNTIAKEALNAIGAQKRILLVQLLDDENDVLEIKVASGMTSEYDYVGTKITRDIGISGWVVRNRKHYLCSNTKNDPYYYELNPKVKSELCVPIMFGEKVIGLINAESLKENDFGEYELQLLQGLADQAAIAIENARLNEGLAATQFKLNETLEIALIGETLAGLTHDIRTCSSLISGEAQWIEHKFEAHKLSIDEAVDAMKKIEAYVARIERLTEDLTRRSQQAPLKFMMLNMADIVKESIYLMYNQANHHKINITLDYPALQFLAEVDERRLRRVFINIIMNAIEAMSDGGILNITANKKNDYCEIKFIDTGKGISESDINKVWDRFFTTKQYGSGMGLAICKRIIEADHNGTISIQSEKNKGTTITVRLPLRQGKLLKGVG